MSHTRRRMAIAAACLLTIGATACSSDSKSGAKTTTAGSTAPVQLTIENSTFTPGSITAGTEFTISNKDTATHTVTDDAGSFDVQVPGGGTKTLTIPTAGTFKIHCKIHSRMHATLTVG
jgi:plastocyanin